MDEGNGKREVESEGEEVTGEYRRMGAHRKRKRKGRVKREARNNPREMEGR